MKKKWNFEWEVPAIDMSMSKWVGTGDCFFKVYPIIHSCGCLQPFSQTHGWMSCFPVELFSFVAATPNCCYTAVSAEFSNKDPLETTRNTHKKRWEQHQHITRQWGSEFWMYKSRNLPTCASPRGLNFNLVKKSQVRYGCWLYFKYICIPKYLKPKI